MVIPLDATCAIASGDYVHTHNVKTNLSDINDYSYQPNFPAIDINEADREDTDLSPRQW